MAIGDKKKVLMEQDIGEVIDPVAIGAYSLMRGTAIPSGADLDTYITPGSYICQTTATAGSLANSPVTTTGFSLQVEIVSGASSNYLHQTLRVNNATADVWKRRYHPTSGWSSWNKFATVEPVIEYELPLVNAFVAQRQNVYYKNQDGIVTVSAELYRSGSNDTPVTDSITVGTLPAGYRPGSVRSFPATWWVASSPAKRIAGSVQINSNGSIVGRIAPSEIVSGVQTNLFIYATFVAV